ncbi:MAG: 2-amino-4-hydroxy-6-hydroxymethyldihydropteridine diphosphokinase [Verrucomicrobiae bacterium]|nr:2-amino-4-hydroxy-6-hydroxymethyldihydropteridine diphosphokinase [Verrucomicrobiae bacterium]
MSASRLPVKVGIALGSNLDQPVGNIREAFCFLESLSIAPILCSSLYETTPVDCPPGSPPFINAVAEITLAHGSNPLELLRTLQHYEVSHGRPPEHDVNAPRTIDLDILYFGDLVLKVKSLTLPHPRLIERQFVLEPLAEIRPSLILPGDFLTVSQRLQNLPARDPAFRKVG